MLHQQIRPKSSLPTTSTRSLQIHILLQLQAENIFSCAMSVTDSLISCRYPGNTPPVMAHHMEHHGAVLQLKLKQLPLKSCATNGLKTYGRSHQQKMLIAMRLCVESLSKISAAASYPRTKLHSEHRSAYGKGTKTLVKTRHEVHCRHASRCSITAKIWLFSAGAVTDR